MPGANRHDTDVVGAWRAAARELAAEASLCTVEDLASRARVLRDLGAERVDTDFRALARYYGNHSR